MFDLEEALQRAGIDGGLAAGDLVIFDLASQVAVLNVVSAQGLLRYWTATGDDKLLLGTGVTEEDAASFAGRLALAYGLDAVPAGRRSSGPAFRMTPRRP